MVAAGIQTRLRSSLQIEMHCFLNDADVAAQASAQGITRSALALKRAISQFPEAIYVIGNAPTALAELTASVKRGAATPRLIVAMPVGFVGVVESKEEAMRLEVPVIAVRGRRGGSAIAAAAVNALLTLAQEESQL
jgi:precorrin-8X/cobalt-precorrin-8 methylmutase